MHDNINYLYNVGWKYKEEKHNELKGRCPSHNHNDKTPSFSINKETGEFNCFSCEMQGKSLISLMMYVENISKEEAIKSLNPEPYKNIYKDIMDFCHYVITYKGERPPSIKHARRCVAEDLKKRNLHGSVVSKYKIGYSHNNLIKNLLKKSLILEKY